MPIRVATAADVPALVDVLVRAFDDDPLLSWAIRNGPRRGDALRRLFELVLLRLTLPYGHVYTTADVRGAALWVPPNRWNQGFTEQLKQLPDWVAIVGVGRLLPVFLEMDSLFRRHPRRPHFYLPFLGVDPSVQGRGIGSALLHNLLQKCDADTVPAYLETSNPRNIPLYERHGFRVVEALEMRFGGPTVWLMWRPGARGTPVA
jgi:ribosomal protein S18 acetylase RimI-like enzyme